MILQDSGVISCPVASLLYQEGKEEGRRKKEEGRRKKEEEKEKPSIWLIFLQLLHTPIPTDMILGVRS